MCGIVGYVGRGNVVPNLVGCLKRLEYRGYDSAGVAVVNGNRLLSAKGAGTIEASEARFLKLSGSIAVGHTRWATHGSPSGQNAHPHTDCRGRVAVVHNGIVENHEALRAELVAEGHKFRSETDTEVVPHLIEDAYRKDLEGAVRAAVARLEGSFAIAVIAAGSPVLVAARRDAPLAVGLGRGEVLVASDVPALLPRTRRVVPLEDREMAVLRRDGAKLTRLDGSPVRRSPLRIPWTPQDAERGGFDHYMLKEIYEQPRALRETLAARLRGLEAGTEPLFRDEELPLDRRGRILLTGCGSSYHAALFGRILLERLAHLPAETRIASELCNETGCVGPGDLLVALSQSGETADTLAAVRSARARGTRILAICNVLGSTLTREADAVAFTHAGPEVSVPATKTFTTQLAALGVLALRLGRRASALTPDEVARHAGGLRRLPGQVLELLDRRERVAPLARRLSRARLLFFLGRGSGYPIALEGALKVKEIAYLPAEGYPAGELKHGPLALLDRRTPVIGLALPGEAYSKLLSNLREAKARGAPVYAVATDGDRDIGQSVDGVLRIPDASETTAPVLAAVLLQLLAYEVARARDCPIDRPRNLAKSVTVE